MPVPQISMSALRLVFNSDGIRVIVVIGVVSGVISRTKVTRIRTEVEEYTNHNAGCLLWGVWN